MGSQGGFIWTYQFTDGMLGALHSLPGIEEPDRRRRLVARTCERLGIQAGFAAEFSDTHMHLDTIVSACKTHQDPPKAVRALVEAARYFWNDAAAWELLKDYDDEIDGLVIIPAWRLHAVLRLLDLLGISQADATVHELTQRSILSGDGNPLRGTEGMAQALRRLNQAREVHGRAPLVLRVLSLWAREISNRADDDQLASLVKEIEAELGYADDLFSSHRGGHADRVKGTRVLRIQIEDDSGPDQVRYTIQGAVYVKTTTGEELIARSPEPGTWCPNSREDWDDTEFADAGSQFLHSARHLTGAIGLVQDRRVEFLLPWALLGRPVERWRVEGGAKWIGHLSPVVVRSLDRQRSATFFSFWQDRWELLARPGRENLVRDRIGWLHYGTGNPPREALQLDHVLSVDGRYGVITEWLAGTERRETIGFALTFAYDHADMVCRQILQDTFDEGIPVLLWRRDNGDAGALEPLLDGVAVEELPARVLEWRRATASSTIATSDARYHVVLLWDDPTAMPSAATFLAAPQ